MATVTMGIGSIGVEPNPANTDDSTISAYRAIRFIVVADTLVTPNQPMYADVYFGFIFYKTFSAYSITSAGGFSLFMFDVQSAAQEYLLAHIPAFGHNYGTLGPQQADPTVYNYVDELTQVYFRGSIYDTVTGIITPGGTPPTQATATTPAISTYSGTVCNSFQTFISAILPNFGTVWDNNLLPVVQQRYITDGTILAGTAVYPMSNLPMSAPNPFSSFRLNKDACVNNYTLYKGTFPFMLIRFGTSGILDNYSRNCEMILIWQAGEAPAYSVEVLGTVNLLTARRCFYLPVGIDDIFALASAPTIAAFKVINNNVYYRIGLFDVDSGHYCFFSPAYKYNNKAIETECLWFQNMFGVFEQVTFVRSQTKFTTTSSEQFLGYDQPITLPPSEQYPLQTGHKRYNVRANDEILLTATFKEGLMPWLTELIASPMVMQQVTNAGGDASFNPYLRSVVIIDGSFDTKKTVTAAGINYTVSLKIRPATDYFIIRN